MRGIFWFMFLIYIPILIFAYLYIVTIILFEIRMKIFKFIYFGIIIALDIFKYILIYLMMRYKLVRFSWANEERANKYWKTREKRKCKRFNVRF